MTYGQDTLKLPVPAAGSTKLSRDETVQYLNEWLVSNWK